MTMIAYKLRQTYLNELEQGKSFRYCRTELKGVMTGSMVDALSELCSPFLKGGNSAFIAAIASGLFPQIEYPSLE